LAKAGYQLLIFHCFHPPFPRYEKEHGAGLSRHSLSDGGSASTIQNYPLLMGIKIKNSIKIVIAFLSLNLPTRLAPVIGAAGLFRASQVAVNALFACHALRPRQVCDGLTLSGRKADVASTRLCFSETPEIYK
jgi:hypothetical protein